MLFFVILMVCGLAGLALMALPGLLQQGTGHPGHSVHLPSVGHGHGHAAGGAALRSLRGGRGVARFLPEPRVVLSLMALFGAFGNVATRWLHLPFWPAVLAGAVPALLLERFALRPVWRLALGFQGQPSSPLAGLVLEGARAVTAFRNGTGIVETVRDGRSIQLGARLTSTQRELPVRVGDPLKIEDVDPETENVTVSIHVEDPHGR